MPEPGQLAMKEVMGYDVYKPHPKVVGLADFHIGNYRYPIRDIMVDLIRAHVMHMAREVNPDVFLFAGDAFRTRTPSAQDYADFGSIVKNLPQELIMIPGNHDIISSREATTLDVFDEYDNVTLIKEPRVIQRRKFQVCCIPWLPQKALDSMGLDAQDNAGAIRALVSLLKAQLNPNKFSILLAHCTALGSEYHDGASAVLGSDVLWTNDMFEGFDLCVLGHIHKPQQVTDNAWYVGSPCPVSFNETNHLKTLFVWDGAFEPRYISGPVFWKYIVDELAELGKIHDFSHIFAQIVKGHGDPDPEEIPNFAWYEIVTLPPEHDMRQRLSADEAGSMSPVDAIRAWLRLEGMENDAVIDLAKELMEE